MVSEHQNLAMSSSGRLSEHAKIFALLPKQVERFRHDGFLALESLMPSAELAIVRAKLQQLFEARAGYDEGACFDFLSAEDDPDKPVMPQILRPSLYAAELLRGVAAKRAAIIARQLIGPEAHLSFDHVLMKPPFDGAATPWHQDDAFADPSFDNESVSVWIPLQAVDRVNGCLSFIPGSPARAIMPHRSPGDDDRVHGLECISGFDDADGVSCPIPAGGCTIHSGRTLHSAGSNRSEAPRYAYVMVFSTPKRPVEVVTSRPWLLQKQTARRRREQSWMRRGGWVVYAWRQFPRIWLRKRDFLMRLLLRRAT